MKITIRASTRPSPRACGSSPGSVGSRGGDHIHRVEQPRLGGEELSEPVPDVSGSSGTSSPPASQASAHMIPGPPALVTIPTRRRPAAAGSRAALRRRGARQALGADHARLLERASTVTSEAARSAPVWELVARPPAAERPLFTTTIGIRRAEPPCDPREAPRIAEGLDVEKRDLRVVVRLPVLEKVVGCDVGAVSDRGEGGNAEATVARQIDQGQTERTALGGEADTSAGRSRRGEGDVQLGVLGGVQDPQAVRAPTNRIPPLQISTSRSWSSAPSGPVSANPAEITTSAGTPLSAHSRATSITAGAGTAIDGEVHLVRHVSVTLGYARTDCTTVGRGVDRVDRALEAGLEQRCGSSCAADRAALARGADNRDRPRFDRSARIAARAAIRSRSSKWAMRLVGERGRELHRGSSPGLSTTSRPGCRSRERPRSSGGSPASPPQ